jgi:hypothetical protein
LTTSQETLRSIKGKPFLECVHFGAIDIGSELKGKFIVSEIDLELMQSYSLFGFSRNDRQKYFVLWIYNYYNISIEQLLKVLLENVQNKKCITLLKEVQTKLPKEPQRKKDLD